MGRKAWEKGGFLQIVRQQKEGGERQMHSSWEHISGKTGDGGAGGTEVRRDGTFFSRQQNVLKYLMAAPQALNFCPSSEGAGGGGDQLLPDVDPEEGGGRGV